MNPILSSFKRASTEPIIKPNPELVFECPMTNTENSWAKSYTFNPACIAYQDKVHMFFRAEDGSGKGLSGHTSRLGYATSSDGITFSVEPHPLLFPDQHQKEYEWPGGLEDPRICRREDGIFVLHYSMWNHKIPRIGVATSPDLVNWTKHGPVFSNHPKILNSWHKAAGVVQRLQGEELIAHRTNGEYTIYFGEFEIFMAKSKDLIHWDPVLDDSGNLKKILGPREGFFDSELTEVGPPPVITSNGIEMIYNGKNHPHAEKGDPGFAKGAYSPATLILDPDDPSQVLERPDLPFMTPELDFEKDGQYPEGTIFAEALVRFQNKWWLYYGASDTYVGVACH